MRSRKYEEGRRKALEDLGFKQRAQDNHLVQAFVDGLGDDKASRKPAPKVNRLERPTSWGPQFNITTSSQDVGVGV